MASSPATNRAGDATVGRFFGIRDIAYNGKMIAGHLTVSFALHQGLKGGFSGVRKLHFPSFLAGAYLPDLIDKPLALLLGIPGRGAGHSVIVLSALFFLLLRFLPNRKVLVWSLLIGTVLHLVEDVPYLHILAWPLLGQWTYFQPFDLVHSFRNYYLVHTEPVLLVIEVASYPFFLYFFLKAAVRGRGPLTENSV